MDCLHIRRPARLPEGDVPPDNTAHHPEGSQYMHQLHHKIKVHIDSLSWFMLLSFSCILRENQHAVRSNGESGTGIQPVSWISNSLHVTAVKPLETVTVNRRITVQAEFPYPGGGHADLIIFFRGVTEIEHHDHIVARSVLVPALESENVVRVIHMVNVQKLPAQPAAEPIFVQPQPNQVPIQADDPLVLFIQVPVQRDIVPEPLAL